ncbi:MAG: GatB/YqeY domain-containing protein [Patescibacteria group bacterium]
MTKKDLQEELKQSMLARNELKTSVLRMLLSAIKYYEIQKAVPAGRQGGAGYEATEEDVMNSIQKEAKQRRDSIEEFKKAERQELADKEQKELELLQKYLPEQLSEEEIKKFVEEAISATGASSMSDMGKLMGALMPKIKGKADGNLVSKIVREKLS